MQLKAYLDRIGFKGAPRADLATLRELHRRHLLTIPYENLDVLFGAPLDLDPHRIFDKLVTHRRGGWCYEMNGLLSWALKEIGFSVTRIAGGVVRDRLGDGMIGNHLVLLVDLDRRYIADVGFGDGLFEPTLLREGEITQRGFVSRLEKVDDRFWRYHNHQHGGAPAFDFAEAPADEALLAARCRGLQTEDNSPFTQNVVLQRHTKWGVAILRNSVRLDVRPDGPELRVLKNAKDFGREIRDVFGLDLLQIEELWPLAERKGRDYLAALNA
ncbi:MAG: arylamine N-acetyltransferase [Hyphomonadaceae bacterium]|nr:arylamine N-acetyltransferase [Hyphomonadaceae bacterium]